MQDSYGSENKTKRTVAIQKCGDPPYEVSLRFAGCNLKCGLCYASGYSWPDMYQHNKSVTNQKNIEDILKDFREIAGAEGFDHYNWFRVLGGEPLLNDEYIDFLFEALARMSELDSNKFNNGIIIQTNGIHIGMGNASHIKDNLEGLYEINPHVKVAVEISIKGGNSEEFELLTQRPSELFKYNLNAYNVLKQLKLPNLRPMIVAGFGLNESYLRDEGKSKDKMTIIGINNRPCYHPESWSTEFSDLYDAFTGNYKKSHPMFSKMPMYGIMDRYYSGYAMRALKQGKRVYEGEFYDSEYANPKNCELENSFAGMLDKFFLPDNQTYYSAMIK